MRILQFGFIDSLNLGDRLIAEEIETQFLDGHQVQKISYDGRMQEMIDLKDVEKIELSTLNKNKFTRKIHSFFKSKPNKKLVKKLIENTDIIVFSGGNLLFDLNKKSKSYKRIDWIIDIAEKNRKPILALSVGVGPFKTLRQQQKAVNQLIRCNYVSVRDDKSSSYFHNKKIYINQDPVFLSEKFEFEEKNKKYQEKQIIGLSVLDYRLAGATETEYQQYLLDLSEIVRGLVESNRSVILYSTEVRDYGAVSDLSVLLENQSDVKSTFIHSLEETVKLYNQLDLIIGTRMHSMIFGFASSIPLIGISWQDKVKEMFELIEQPHDCVSIVKLSSKKDEIINYAEKKLNNISEEKKHMKKIFEQFEWNRNEELERLKELLDSSEK